MKKKFLFVSICLLAFTCLSVAFADAEPDVVVSLQIDNPIMEVNGVKTEIDEGRGTRPVIENGRTLVPIRAVVESFGGTAVWDENSHSVVLSFDGDTIKLVIDSNTAYLNDKTETLEVAPAVINGRTMLPIRFIAEGFKLGVAWNGETRTVYIIKSEFDGAEYDALMRELPDYSGQAYVQINNNEPMFKSYEIIDGDFEYYSKLDELGRCNVCFASVSQAMMPNFEREDLSSVTPTGWLNAEYGVVDGGYLYNRCHLIGFQLTGENANSRNLITGTRYLNVSGMLPFENETADYIKETGNSVMYRATPVFKGNNLVADGVLLEAYSVEDCGQGLSFCVYCYNVQPQIKIDYATGASAEAIFAADTADSETVYDKDFEMSVRSDVDSETNVKTDTDIETGSSVKFYRTPKGAKYHFKAECGGKNSYEITAEEARRAGLSPCSKCAA